MKIVLIGFMCSGKSKVGRLLAKKIGWTFLDTDELIIKDEGLSIAELIRSKGEPVFREYEKRAVHRVSARDEAVIATGGGVPLYEENMKKLSQGSEIVWLKVSPETVLSRAGDLKSRPLIDPDHPLESIKQRLKDREPFYAQAHHMIECDGKSPHEVVDLILSVIPQIHP